MDSVAKGAATDVIPPPDGEPAFHSGLAAEQAADARFGRAQWQRLAVALAAGLILIALFSRIMNYPLRHDEQSYLPAGILFPAAALYGDINYNHLPNLPILLSCIFGLFGTEHYLLAGRVLTFTCWLAMIGAAMLIAWRWTLDYWVVALSGLLLVTNTTLLGPAGMLVSNNLLPVPFVLLGLYFFLSGVDRPVPDWRLCVLSGLFLALGIGFKVNYVFVLPPFVLAAFFLPRQRPFALRLRYTVAPMLVGGIIGGAPTLYYLLTAPGEFLSHVLRWHQTAHRIFWGESGDPKILTFAEKIQLAETVWLAGAVLLSLVAVAAFGLMSLLSGDRRSRLSERLGWPAGLVFGLVVMGAGISFIPTPSFPQYFVPPMAFLVVLAVLLYARLDMGRRTAARPLLMALTVLALMTGASRLAADAAKILTPSQWTGLRVHRLAADMAVKVRAAGGNAKVATLSPVYPLEAGLKIYPELAAGPFMYRTADLIKPADRKYFRLVSEAGLPAFLDADPPAAILVGLEGEQDNGLRSYAAARGYRKVSLGEESTRYGEITLFVRP